MHRLPARILVGLAAFASLTGCSNDPPLGNVEIPFEIGVVAAACSTAGVVNVRMTITQQLEEGGQAAPLTEEASCEEGKVVFSGINAGTYELLAEGLAGDDVVIVDNLDAGSLKSVEVLENTTVTSDPVVLTFTPAKILVRWALNKGGFQANCADVATAKFEITAAKSGGIVPLGAPAVFDCDTAADAGMGYHTVPDAMRLVDGATLDTVIIQPLDATDTAVGAKLSVMLEPPGPGRSVNVSLTCTDDVCEAALTP